MELSKCKVCGYITETGKIGEVCPACGVASKVFEPYKLTLSEDRYKLLSLHMHPVILHFPQAFVVTATGMLLLSFLFTGTWYDQIITVIQFNLLFLPLTVLMGAATGIKDGQLRFKKLSPPALQLKIRLSIAFFGLSVITGLMAVFMDMTVAIRLILLLLCVLQTLIAVLLGRTGATLIDAFLPGK